MPFGSAKYLLTLLVLIACSVSAAQIQNIPLLDNRFRIDHSVEAVTLLVQRRKGSRPVVVVQPDGSKWYFDRHPKSVQWSYTDNSDMVRIEKPTPGPWQLVGSVEKESQVRVLSGIELNHEPFPDTLYRGQRLKINAELVGDGDRIAMRDFYQQLQWKVRLSSENRSGDENFGAGPFDIGDYQDNGRGLDEIPDDGVFAAELNFNYPAGLYNLAIRVSNPVFSREAAVKIDILPQPVRLNVAGEPGAPHTLEIDIMQEVVLDELHLLLQITTPDQTTVDLNLTPQNYQDKVLLDMLKSYGSYFMSGRAIGTDIHGNEFLVDLPKLNFYLAPPPPAPPSEEELRQKAYEEALEKERQAKQKVMSTLTNLLIGIVVLLIAGAVGWFVYRKRKAAKLAAEQAEEETPIPELTPDAVDLSAFTQQKE